MNNLTFKCINNTLNIKLIAVGNPYTINLKFKIDDSGWSYYKFGDVINLTENQTVSFFGDPTNINFSKDLNNFYKFVIQGNGYTTITGNINSLTQKDQIQKAPNFNRLFENCKQIVDASQLELPFNNLSNNCYARLFFNCDHLLTPPQLPATVLAQKCYWNMFKKCTSLTVIPQLPAINLAIGCYQSMFECCTNLRTISVLPAVKLIKNCYNSMFYNCSNLNQIEVKFLTWSNYNATDIWLSNVAKEGTFIKPKELEEKEGKGFIPRNWIVVNNTDINNEEVIQEPEDEIIQEPEQDILPSSFVTYTAGSGLLLDQNNQFSLTGTILSVGEGLKLENNIITLTADIPTIPFIPTKISDLENDSEFITQHQDLSEYAKITDLPRKYSDLNDDKHFVTFPQAVSTFAFSGAIPTKISQLQNDVGVITNEQLKNKFIQLFNNDQEIRNLIITTIINNLNEENSSSSDQIENGN